MERDQRSRVPTRDTLAPRSRRASQKEHHDSPRGTSQRGGPNTRLGTRQTVTKTSHDAPRTRPSTDVFRDTYRQPVNFESRVSTEFDSYLKKTRVQEIYRKLLHELLIQPELPYNPYPTFYSTIKQHAEKFHLFKDRSEEIERRLSNAVEETRVFHLYTLTHHEGLYGLPTILRAISPPTLDQYRWLVSNLSPIAAELPVSEGYSTHVTSALVGPCVFHGSLYPEVQSFQVRVELVIAGADKKEAQTLFVNQVLHDIERTAEEGSHVVNEAIVPTAKPDRRSWTPGQIAADKDGFIRETLSCVRGNRYIHIEGVFLLEPESTSYIRGQKQYGLNFLQVYDEPEKEELLSFCEFPMGLLHEGVFFDKAQAEGYITMFALDNWDDHVTDAAEVGNDVDVAPTATTHEIKKGTYKVREEKSTQHVLIDGFRFKDDKRPGAFAWKITTPIRGHYQKKIAGLWSHFQLLDIAYCVVILATMDSKANSKNHLLIELYRLLHGTSGRLMLLAEHTTSLKVILESLSSKGETVAIEEALEGYRSALVSVFLDPLIERSHDFLFVGLAALARLDDVMSQHEFELGATVDALTQIHDLMGPLMIETAEVGRNLLPHVNTLIMQTHTLFPDESPLPSHHYIKKSAPKPKPRPTGFNRFLFGDSDDEEEEDEEEEYVEEYVHGHEDDRIIAHGTSVLVVEDCVKRDTLAPPLIVTENVILQYMLDCHLDEMWSDYLIDLAGGDLFPPNPFPRLISILRQSAMRMDVCLEQPSHTTERMFNLEVKLEDADNFVFRVPDLDAFGCVTALMLFDPGAMINVLEVVKNLQQRSFIQKKGPYRVGICLALSGPSVWYGRMQPYLNEIVLHEHYYIQGPSGRHGEALELCAVIVQSHVLSLMEIPEVLVTGVLLDGPNTDLWTCEAIRENKRAFITQFCNACSARQDIILKSYVVLDTWRYVPVLKRIRLHYMEKDSRVQMFFQEQPEEYYQTVFVSKNRAAFFYQNCGLPHNLDPMQKSNVVSVAKDLEIKMAASYRLCDWLNFYRHLLLRDLILQDQTRIADCWKMFHSIAGQVEYIVGLLESHAELVEFYLEAKKHVTDANVEATVKEKVKPKQATKKKVEKNAEVVKNKYQLNNSLDLAILKEMIRATYDKLKWICEASVIMTSKGLGPYVMATMNRILKFEPGTDFPVLDLESHTPEVLRQVCTLLRPLLITMGGDVLNTGADVDKTRLVPRRSELRDSPRRASPLSSPGFKFRATDDVPTSRRSMLHLIRPEPVTKDPVKEQGAVDDFTFPPRYMTIGVDT